MLLPTPKDVRGAPCPETEQWIGASRRQALQILSGKDKRLAIVVGPCSIHHFEAALEYAMRLESLAKKVSKQCFLIMRVFCEKPRTIGGWKGLLYDPYLDGSHAIAEGLTLSRKLLLELAKRRVPAAAEFVNPLLASYLEDLITWGFIGARTSASPTHRELASHLCFPVGFKNGLDGDVCSAIHALVVARKPQVFPAIDENGALRICQSLGNPSTHLVLRGSMEKPNYEPESVASAVAKMEEWNIAPRIMIDCAHGNCQKQYRTQVEVLRAVLKMRKRREIIGLMLESYLQEGNQLQTPYSPAISITDPCLGWEETESLIEDVCSSSLI